MFRVEHQGSDTPYYFTTLLYYFTTMCTHLLLLVDEGHLVLGGANVHVILTQRVAANTHSSSQVVVK